jgi:hypothetical protein
MLLARSVPLSALLLLLILVFALFAPRPDLPINDEWCYVHLANTFIAKGKIELGGCSIALGFPTYLFSAAFTWLFGPSFFVLRSSILAFALVASVFMYLLSRRIGISRERSAFASAIVMLSPVTLPNILTYMTDVPALALLLGASYFGYCAIEAIEGGSTKYLLAALFLYMVGVMVRQVIAVYGVMFFASVALFGRSRQRRFYVPVLCCAAVTVAAIGVQFWAEHRIDRVWIAGSSLASLREITHLRVLAANFVKLLTTLLVFLLPGTIVVGFEAPVLDSSTVRRGSLLLLFSVALLLVSSMGGPFPQLGNLVTEYGFLYPRQMGFGDRPAVLTSALRWIITGVAFVFATLSLVAVHDRWRSLTSCLNERLLVLFTTKASRFFLTIHTLAAVAYLVIIDSRSMWWLGDRYLLLCLPFFVLLIADLDNICTWLPYVSGCLVVLIFAAFSLASVHDYASEQAGRRTVFAKLVARGVAQNDIIIGKEQDFWREIETKGFVDYRFQNPLYSPAWSYQSSRNVSLLKPHAAIVVGRSPGAVLMEIEPACFRSLLTGHTTCVYAVELQRSAAYESQHLLDYSACKIHAMAADPIREKLAQHPPSVDALDKEYSLRNNNRAPRRAFASAALRGRGCR